MAKVIHSLGSFCRGLFSDALQFLKRWFIQSPDLLFMSVSSRGISACNSTSTLGGPCLREVPVTSRLTWPHSGSGHCGHFSKSVYIPPSNILHRPLCAESPQYSLSMGSLHLFCYLLSFLEFQEVAEQNMCLD